jgi:hypothetical protein
MHSITESVPNLKPSSNTQSLPDRTNDLAEIVALRFAVSVLHAKTIIWLAGIGPGGAEAQR